MRPAIIWGLGNLGRALVRTIEATGLFDIAAIIETAPGAAGGRLPDLMPGSRSDAPVYADLAEYGGPRPAALFHVTTSEPTIATRQILFGLQQGHAVISAAEWLFHPWLRYGEAADALDAAARAGATQALGCGINPGFCFETLPLLLSRTVHSVSSVNILRVSNVSGVGPADFAHLGFGLREPAFFEQVANGAIVGHMGFPESIAALAECLGVPVDRITDHLVPTLATQPLQLAYRLVSPGEVVGITQTAIGYVGSDAVIDMRLEMFLDPEAYGRTPQEAIDIKASRSFSLSLKPAAPPVQGAAAMMVHAAALLPDAPPGLASLLDLPIGRTRLAGGLRVHEARRSTRGTDLAVRQGDGDPRPCRMEPGRFALGD